MALVSPGVEVDIIDQSQYLPAAQNSVPLVVVATAQNKADPTGVGVAQATTAANAGKLYQVTSQRDLVTLYGNPFFYTTTNGTPIQGYELNEYGLLAAYSTLGVTNNAYILRADIDLASLVGKAGRPVGTPADGTYWLDTTNTTWGIYEFNAATGTFTNKVPYVITDVLDLSGSYPSQSIGNIGDYAVNAMDNDTTNPVNGYGTYFFKNTGNQWVKLGSGAWRGSWPVIQGTNTNPTLTTGSTITFSYNGAQFVVTSGTTVNSLVNAFNAIGIGTLTSANVNGKFTIYDSNENSASSVNIISATNGILATLGTLTAGTYYSPRMNYSNSAGMPLWTAGQTQPNPSGSVWLKVGAAGTGLAPAVSEYNTATASWKKKSVPLYPGNAAANADLDPTGGQAIPAGTVYCEYAFGNLTYNQSAPLTFLVRSAIGYTSVTGSVTDPVLTSGPYPVRVNISTPGSSTLSSAYIVTIPDNATTQDVVVAWTQANIPYTTATVASNGALTLTHTQGGEIILSDFGANSGDLSTYGISNGALAALGFVNESTPGCTYGYNPSFTYPSILQSSTSGAGSGSRFNVNVVSNIYTITSIANGGTGHAVGDIITITGTNLGGAAPANNLEIAVTAVDGGGAITSAAVHSGTPLLNFTTKLSNWYPLTYTASATTPTVAPLNNTNWFYSVDNQVDIMVNFNGAWYGYKNRNYDSNGFPTSGTNYTDPNGPLCQATMPTTQSDGTPLVYGDLWIDTGDLENYPVIHRWQSVNTTDQWVLINNTDQVDSTGIVFADARWAPNGTTNPYSDAIPAIQTLLTSNYLDLDAPSPSLYPSGMLLFNTRRSGYNVKQFRTNYFNSVSFPDQSLPEETDAWVTVSGNQSNGSPYMGRKAQRAMVVKALNAVIETNTAIRDEDNYFNLIATPNYPECQPTMVALNGDRGETGYIVGDTPMRLPEDATAISAWATDAAGATSTGEDGLVTRDSYMGLFYPSGLTTDLSGNLVAVPSSHMMLRTIIRNDSIAYPWFAPAGTRRGIIDNAASIGYLDSATGEFVTTKTRLGIRDVLYTNAINPMVFFTGQGLLNYGNKSSFESSSALDRINVARLVAYMRRQLTLAARPFVFEPNDAITRAQIQGVIQTLMVDLVAKRGIYDYLVVCDGSNNTPARIDRNELWVDVAIEPVKAAEFIYIPVRVLNTGAIAKL